METYQFTITYFSFVYALIIGLPLAGGLLNALIGRRTPETGARFATGTVWASALLALCAAYIQASQAAPTRLMGLLYVDRLAGIMSLLILLVSGIVHHYSLRYMAGDREYRRYFSQLSVLTSTVLLLVMADHLSVLLVGWLLSNGLLVRLMIHKMGWNAAWRSGTLSLQVFFGGVFMLVMGVGILANVLGTWQLSDMLQSDALLLQSDAAISALLLIMMGAMTQSAQIPFQYWLISSLNSPTPVSALMHAGLVNAGGFLLARFAPFYLTQSGLLIILFIIGLSTAITGTLWKLIQPDVKRMLACSTMGQMGFMVMQCGLGLFPAAIAHLCWHGLFKAFLFLNAGSTIRETRREVKAANNPIGTFLAACLCGMAGVYAFAVMSDKVFWATDTTAILLVFAYLATTQVAQTVLNAGKTLIVIPLALLITTFMGGVYGLSVHIIEQWLAPMAISEPQPLTAVHLVGVGLMVVIWLGLNVFPVLLPKSGGFWRYWYVRLLNASQPQADTTTAIRSTYHI